MNKMAVAYLVFNAVLYALLAVWCVAAPAQTSTFLGLARSNPAGESEYLAIYGGLQAGLAVFYALAVALPAHRRSALLLSLAVYGGIVLLRTVAGLRLGFGALGNARFAYGLEVALLLSAFLLVVREPN